MFQTVVFREFNNFSSLLLPLYQLVSNVFLQKNSEKVQIYKNLWHNCCIRTIFSWLYIKQDRILFYLCLTQSYFFQKQICSDFVNNLFILRSWFSTNCEILVRNSIFFTEALVTFILLILTLVMIWCQIRENRWKSELVLREVTTLHRCLLCFTAFLWVFRIDFKILMFFFNLTQNLPLNLSQDITSVLIILYCFEFLL